MPNEIPTARIVKPLHLVKLCVGVSSIEDLAHWQAARLAERKTKGLPPHLEHTTFQTPKRQDELLAGGSLYWVIKGIIEVRQRLVGFGTGMKDDGSACCLLQLDPELIPVLPAKRRPFQGWRYLSAEDAPGDVGSAAAAAELASLTPQMRKDLAELGLI